MSRQTWINVEVFKRLPERRAIATLGRSDFALFSFLSQLTVDGVNEPEIRRCLKEKYGDRVDSWQILAVEMSAARLALLCYVTAMEFDPVTEGYEAPVIAAEVEA